MRIKWLHLSDIHFAFQNQDSYFLRKALITQLQNLAQNNDFTHLFISGDLLNRYCIDSDKLEETADFINAIVEAIKVPLPHVIIVPGNHDHNRNDGKTIIEDIYKNPEKADEKTQ